MPAFSAFRLWDAAVVPAQQKRFLRLALVTDAAGAEQAKQCADSAGMFGWVSALPYEALFASERPFFWNAVEACIRAAFGSPSDANRIAAACERVAVFALDALFEACPVGFELALGSISEEVLVLPELGLRIPGGRPFTLRKQGSRLLAICTGSEVTLADVDAPPCALRWTPAPIGSPDRRLVTEAGHLMFGESYRDSIAASLDVMEARELAQTLDQALDFLIELDASFGEEIAGRIGWYVPLKSADPHVHLSFSIPKLTGVIFLSEPTPQMGVPAWLKAAEAVVHEFAHNELNLYQESHVVIEQDAQQRFYSPWRNDPRPLNGLLHGLYAFWHVAEFFRCAELSTRTVPHHVEIRRMRHRLLLQLDIASRQLRPNELSAGADEIVDAIRTGVADRLAQFDGAELPEIAAHVAKWQLSNPAYASSLRLQ